MLGIFDCRDVTHRLSPQHIEAADGAPRRRFGGGSRRGGGLRRGAVGVNRLPSRRDRGDKNCGKLVAFGASLRATIRMIFRVDKMSIEIAGEKSRMSNYPAMKSEVGAQLARNHELPECTAHPIDRLRAIRA